MKTTAGRKTSCAAAIAAILALAGCDCPSPEAQLAGNAPPTLEMLAPQGPVTVEQGIPVEIRYRDDDPDDVAMTDLYADEDGDLATVGDQIMIEAGRPDGDGVAQTVSWDTTLAPTGEYRIVGRTMDDDNTAISRAPGSVKVDPATPATPASFALQLEYVKQAGGVETDTPQWVASFPDGSYVVLGRSFRGPAVFGPGEPGETVVDPGRFFWFLARYQRDGMLDWVFAFPQGTTPIGVATFDDGTCVVGGRFAGTITLGAGETNETTLVAAGPGSDVLVARYGAAGQAFVWARRDGGVGPENTTGIAAVPDGSCVLVGMTSGTSALFGAGEANETVISDVGVFVARYGADGSLVWARADAGSFFSPLVAAFADGGCAVAGTLNGAAVFDEGTPNETSLQTAGKDDIFLARYGSDGEFQWARTDGGAPAEEFGGLATLPDGSILVTGSIEDESVFGAGEPNETTLVAAEGGDDIFVAHYDANGTLAHVRQDGYGGEASDDGFYVAALPDGTVIVAGKYNSPEAVFGLGGPNETTLPTTAGDNLFIAHYTIDAEGRACVFDYVYGDNGYEPSRRGGTVAIFPDGSVVVVGVFEQPTTFGGGEPNETTLEPAATPEQQADPEPDFADDIWIARYAPVTG